MHITFHILSIHKSVGRLMAKMSLGVSNLLKNCMTLDALIPDINSFSLSKWKIKNTFSSLTKIISAWNFERAAVRV